MKINVGLNFQRTTSSLLPRRKEAGLPLRMAASGDGGEQSLEEFGSSSELTRSPRAGAACLRRTKCSRPGRTPPRQPPSPASLQDNMVGSCLILCLWRSCLPGFSSASRRIRGFLIKKTYSFSWPLIWEPEPAILPAPSPSGFGERRGPRALVGESQREPAPRVPTPSLFV